MIQKFKSALLEQIINIPGWRTNRKIVVIESDDWGSVRMRSREVYDRLILLYSTFSVVSREMYGPSLGV
mgnify:CR=1 FL=1